MFKLARSVLSQYISNKNLLNSSFKRFSSENISGPVIGIDLGTTNSCVAVMEGNDPRVIVNAEGHRTTPSVVAFLENGQVLVGEAAKRQAVSNSKNTLYGTKRLIGRRFKDPEVQDEAKHLPFTIVESKNGDVWFRARDKEYSPSQIGAHVLGKMKDTAKAYLGIDVKHAVVTVPAYFNDSQRQATKDAGEIAGLNVVRIINEPTAAALAYGLNKKEFNKIIAVYDLGGGTFDISILEISDGVFEVKSTNGDTRLGGEDFDNCIIKYLIETINSQLKTDVRQDLKALQRIKEAAEKAKTELSFAHQSEINLPYLIGANSFSCNFTRSKLEELVSGLIDRTLKPCATALKDANITKEKLNEVILVGGMTRMPKVQQVVKDFFNKEPSKGINPDEAVAIGAAIQGGVLVGSVSDIVLVDSSAYSLGVRTLGDVFSVIVPKSSTIPTRKTEVFTTSEDNQTHVDISIFQGERSMCVDNLPLGDFRLGPLPPRRRGETKIEVTIELDANGIMNVSAIDVESRVKANITLRSNPRGLSKEQLKKMAEEAEKLRETDAKRKAIAIARTECESGVYDARRYIEQNGSLLDATIVEESTKKLNDISASISTSEGKEERYFLDKKVECSEILAKLMSLKREYDDKQKEQEQSKTDEAEPKPQ